MGAGKCIAPWAFLGTNSFVQCFRETLLGTVLWTFIHVAAALLVRQPNFPFGSGITTEEEGLWSQETFRALEYGRTISLQWSEPSHHQEESSGRTCSP